MAKKQVMDVVGKKALHAIRSLAKSTLVIVRQPKKVNGLVCYRVTLH